MKPADAVELEFTSEQEELRDGVRSVLSRECPMSLVRAVVEDGAPATGLWTQMVELGWPALTIAEDLGGLGTLVDQKVRSDDVTGQVVDLDARITATAASVVLLRSLPVVLTVDGGSVTGAGSSPMASAVVVLSAWPALAPHALTDATAHRRRVTRRSNM